MTGSNRRPPACKAGALPAELIPQFNQTKVKTYFCLESGKNPWRSQMIFTGTATCLVGLVGLEPTTPALSTRCSNQLSYSPKCCSSCSTVDKSGRSMNRYLYLCNSRKEVIQPHLPIRLPCYDFTPVTNPTVVSALLAVKLPTSGKTRSHGVTGGVYKTRERIHRDMLIRDY